MPEGFPPLTLGNQRVLCVVSQKSPGKLVPVMEAFYHSLWVDGNAKIGQPEEFTPILEGVLGKSGAQEILQAVSYNFQVLGGIVYRVCAHSDRQTKQKPSRFCHPTQNKLTGRVPLVFPGLNAPIQRAKPRASGALIISARWPTSWV